MGDVATVQLKFSRSCRYHKRAFAFSEMMSGGDGCRMFGFTVFTAMTPIAQSILVS